MARKKRNPLKPISIAITPTQHRELSKICWALDRGIADLIREMVENDLPRFKDRHRQAIRDGKKSAESQEGSDSVGS